MAFDTRAIEKNATLLLVPMEPHQRNDGSELIAFNRLLTYQQVDGARSPYQTLVQRYLSNLDSALCENTAFQTQVRACGTQRELHDLVITHQIEERQTTQNVVAGERHKLAQRWKNRKMFVHLGRGLYSVYNHYKKLVSIDESARKVLMGTETAYLFLDTEHPYWGRGHYHSWQPNLMVNHPNALNWGGIILMTVRTDIQKMIATGFRSQQVLMQPAAAPDNSPHGSAGYPTASGQTGPAGTPQAGNNPSYAGGAGASFQAGRGRARVAATGAESPSRGRGQGAKRGAAMVAGNSPGRSSGQHMEAPPRGAYGGMGVGFSRSGSPANYGKRSRSRSSSRGKNRNGSRARTQNSPAQADAPSTSAQAPQPAAQFWPPAQPVQQQLPASMVQGVFTPVQPVINQPSGGTFIGTQPEAEPIREDQPAGQFQPQPAFDAW